MGDGRNWLFSGLLVAVVVVLGLVVKGGEPGAQPLAPLPMAVRHDIGAIVIERQRVGAGPASAGLVVFDSRTETSASGRLVAIYGSAEQTGGNQQQAVNVGNSEEIYYSRTNTIYETTFKALVAAEQRLIEASARGGSQAESSTVTTTSYGTSSTPGWTSQYVEDVRDHSYRIAAETKIAGHPAVELIPTPARRRIGSGYETLPTVYVSPSTFEPIRSVMSYHSSSGGGVERYTIDWLEYKVIPATPANRRLLSLTALHPNAKISHSAMAYARATARPNSFGSLSGSAHPGAASGSS